MKSVYDWCGHFHRQIQRTDECFGNASTTEFSPDIKHLVEEIDVINERNHKILHGTEKVLKRNPGLTTHEYIYQKKEKKGSTRTNALIQLGNEMIFAGRQFGEATTYGKCLLSAGRCQEELGHEELRYVTQVAMVFLTPLRRFMETDLKQALERRALTSSRLELDYARQRQKKAKTPDKQVQVWTCQFRIGLQPTRTFLGRRPSPK
ncbi:hypothetical protein RvY_09948-2 [Ramazzottius varieornatus]|uniref:BAR domain-containing protein n=1 Tax=Ramazzottius varieornatus TaxID=947166 RepID=A0A1D1VIX7_RAMVA|nr:hypothetical protein RvY_09948-2 [Ramazzottius varieornatus]